MGVGAVPVCYHGPEGIGMAIGEVKEKRAHDGMADGTVWSSRREAYLEHRTSGPRTAGDGDGHGHGHGHRHMCQTVRFLVSWIIN